MPRCSCAGNSCSCIIQAGTGLVLTGTGNNAAPFTIGLANPYLSITHPANGSLDLSLATTGSIVEVLLSGNVTNVLLPVQTGARIELFLKQIVAGRTVAWPSSIKWPGGTAPTLASTANYGDWIVLRQLQTDWIGAVEGAAIR